MRSLVPVLPVLVVLMSCVWGLALADAGGRQAAAVPVSASGPDGDAAARHAKRTACLKEAKARKLIGAQKAAFLKECVGGR
jgi:hypothetical protein